MRIREYTEEEEEKHLKRAYKKFANALVHNRVSFSMRLQVQSELDKRMYDEYMKECGVDKVEEIDYNNPVVAVAHLLNDPLYNHYIMHGTQAQKQIVYDLMTAPMLDVYWNYTDEHGCKFCDKESKIRRSEIKKQYKASKHQ